MSLLGVETPTLGAKISPKLGTLRPNVKPDEFDPTKSSTQEEGHLTMVHLT